MVDLTQWNQHLTREVNRKHRQWRAEEHGQNSKNGGALNSVEGGDQSRGIVTRRVPTFGKRNGLDEEAMEEMKYSMKRVNQVDDLVHKTNSPFIASITCHPLPSKFKMSSLESYDGTRDPCDHITMFKTTMHFQGISDEIMCRAFPTTLKGPAKVWFGKLPPNTITSFQELSKLFVNNFVKGQRHKGSSSSLLNIEQGENESFQTFINRFNKEALLVDEMDCKILLAAFYNGVTSNLFIHKLYDQEP